MITSVTRQLSLKDLYLARWSIVGSMLVAAVALAVMPLASTAAYAGTVVIICVLIVQNIYVVMAGVVQEQKDKVTLFVLSLPLSTTQYLATKVAANAAAFMLPWVAITIATVVLIDISALPNGLLPYWIAVLTYLLFYYCVHLAVALVSGSMMALAAVITLGNLSANFFIAFLTRLPSVVQHRDAPAAVWTADIIGIIALQLAGGVAALLLAWYVRSRRPDFI